VSMAEPNSTVAAVAAVPLITVFVALFGASFGPYVLIFIGAVCGSMWAVLSAPPFPSRWGGLWLVGRSVLLSLLLTAGIAKLVADTFGWPVSEMYIIVSISIAGLGDRWLDVLDSIKTRVQTMITTGGTKP
jgi:hypothetical protein